jgi:phosphotriesterase-related protein
VRRRQLYPDWRWTHIAEDVVPELRRRGVSQEAVDRMLIDNPREIFSRRGGY